MVIVQAKKGERIFLDSLDPERLSVEYQRWMKDPEVLRWLAYPEGDYSPEALKKFVSGVNASPSDCLMGVFLKSTDQHIGNVKIGKIDPKHRFADIGIVVGLKSIWGQGFATEILCLVSEVAFTELALHKLCAGIVTGNEGSYKAFKKAGFADVGRSKDHWLVDGTYRDVYLLEKIKA